jgi:peptidoglycan hydrolase-like protein with peptidoglycan-binding domain
MKRLAIVLTAITVCFPVATLARSAFTSNHPEEAYPDNAPPLTSGGQFEDLLKQVQEKLHARGFDAGPANGTFNSKTQAALAQFQLSNVIPASGALDDATLAELGVQRAATGAAAGGGQPSR